ncbi:MAG: peptide chain release factor N(5)-glutamine methyltransferase [Deltaproteobacteria bacterium]|jgi:release factor glutamine methyltransferase
MTGERTKRWSILEVLDWTRGHFEKKGLASPRLDAEVLIAHALGLKRVMLYAKYDQPLVPEELAKIRNLVARRANAEPIAHLTGSREFWSLDFEVTRDTLVPRPDTETLVEVALDAARGRDVKTIVDVGTGTGCVAIAIAKEHPDAKVWALDISEAARTVAERNVEKHGMSDRVTILASDLLHALPHNVPPIDLLVSNPPYIPSADIAKLMADVRDHEPSLALDGGDDGLDLVRRLVEQAPERLAPGGVFALEAGYDQHKRIRGMLSAFVDVATVRDPGGHERVTWGRRP